MMFIGIFILSSIILLISFGYVYAENESASQQNLETHSGQILFNQSVYPVPWGSIDNFPIMDSLLPNQRAIFPLHKTVIAENGKLNSIEINEVLPSGDLTVHVRLWDPDFNVSPTNVDEIATSTNDGVGPIKITLSRGDNRVILGYAGGPVSNNGLIDSEPFENTKEGKLSIRQFGPVKEIGPDKGFFVFEFKIKYSDGPADERCPVTSKFESLYDSEQTFGDASSRFDDSVGSARHCILKGDIITAEYTDPNDEDGNENIFYDSSIFELRTGQVLVDNFIYTPGSDAILTLIEPDFDLDGFERDKYSLDLIAWKTDEFSTSIGKLGGEIDSFDPSLSEFIETGDSTGIFQVVITIPEKLKNKQTENDQKYEFQYFDWGPADSIFVGQQHTDIREVLFVSETNNTDSENFFLEYKNPDENIMINYPLNWNVLEPDDTAILVMFQSPRDGIEDDYLENVVISLGGKTDSQYTLKDYSQVLIETLDSDVNDRFLLLDSSEIILSGEPAYKIEYASKFDNMNFKRSIWIIANDSKYYLIGYSAQSSFYDMYLPTFQKIIESFEITSISQEKPNVKSQIPDWIRNNASWWVEGNIDDKAFVGGIQFLIKEGLIQIPETTQSDSNEKSKEIPSWIKNNADWWSQGLIQDADFLKGITFLVENGIITI